MKKDLFDLLKELEGKSEEVRDVFGDCDLLDGCISTLWEIIEAEFKVSGNDLSGEWFMDYCDGKITKKGLKNKLKRLAKKL